MNKPRLVLGCVEPSAAAMAKAARAWSDGNEGSGERAIKSRTT